MAAETKTSVSDREFAFVVFGVTGVTGWQIAKELAATLAGSSKRFAVAGRRKEAVQERANELTLEHGTKVATIVVDAADAAGLEAMAKRTQVVLACAGPFRFLGRPVAEACAKSGTSYADITGEPMFSEQIAHELDPVAAKTGATLVTCAGFDSVPADLGLLYAKRQFLKEFGDKSLPTGVVSSLSLNAGDAGVAVNIATYESAVHGFGTVGELKRLRKSAVAGVPAWARPGALRVGKKLRVSGGLGREPSALGSRLTLPFPGSDASVVRRSQLWRWRQAGAEAGLPESKPGAADASTDTAVSVSAAGKALAAVPRDCVPVQHACYIALPSWWVAMLTMIAGFVLSMLAQFAWGRSILLASPGLFTFGMFKKGGPTEEQKAGTSFEMRFITTGYKPGKAAELALSHVSMSRDAPVTDLPAPDAALLTTVDGPEPGYIATPACIIAVAFCLLELRGRTGEDGKLLVPAGVLTPAAALAHTDIFERLADRGVRFRNMGVCSPK
jgi:short subunit dehydrogenase-like uncharacterized protein